MKEKCNDQDISIDPVDTLPEMPLEKLTLHVREDLYRAFQRCKWLLVSESGRDQVEIMDEMVRDFLVKHGC